MADIKIVLTTDANGVVTGFATANGAVDAFAEKVESAALRAGTAIDNLQQNFLNLAAKIYIAYAALQQMHELMLNAARYEEVYNSLTRLAEAYGTTADSIISRMKDASQGTLSAFDAIKVASEGLAKHLNPDQIVNITQAARTFAISSGKDMKDILEQISTALETGRLRGLQAAVGIIDLKDKFGEAEATMSKTRKALEMYNLLMEKEAALHKVVGDSADSHLTKMHQFKAIYEDVKIVVGQVLLEIFDVVKKVLGGLGGFLDFFKNLPSAASEGLGGTLKVIEEWGRNAISIFTYVITSISATFALLFKSVVDVLKLIWKELSATGKMVLGIFTLDPAMIKQGLTEGVSAGKQAWASLSQGGDAYIKTIMSGYDKFVADINKTNINKAITVGSLPSGEHGALGTDKAAKDIAAAKNAWAEYYKVLSEMDKAYNAEALKELENRYKAGEIAEADYYAAKQTIYEKDYQTQVDDINKEIMATAEGYNAAMKVAKTKEEQDKVMAEYAVKFGKEDLALTKANLDLKAKYDKDYTDIVTANRQVEINDAESAYKQQVETAKAALSEQEAAIEELTKYNDDAYAHARESATDYYNNASELVTRLKDAKEQELTDEYDALVANLEKQYYVYDNNAKKQEEILNKLREADAKYDADIEKNEKDSSAKIVNIKLKEANDVAAIYEKYGANGVIGETIDEITAKWNQHGKDVADITTKTYEGAASAFSNIFYDAITGKLKSLGDYFKSLFNSILKWFTDMLGRMVAEGLSNPIKVIIQSVSGATEGLSGMMGTGTLGGTLGWGALGYGIGSMFGGQGGIGGSIGGMATNFFVDSISSGILDVISTYAPSLMFSGLGAILDVGLPVIGSLLGGLIGSLFGGSGRPPAMDISYAPGQVPSHIGEGWAGASYQGAGGRWEVVGQHGVDTSALDPVAKAFNDIGDATKDILSKLGLDISGFSKEWHKYIADMSNMTADQAKAAMEQAMTEYISFASNIDFSKFQRSGEQLIDTVKRIMNALGQIAEVIKPSWDATLKTGWDIAKMYDAIDVHASTYKEALSKIDAQIADDVTAMNSGALTSQQWGDKLTEIGTLLACRYKLEIQYLTYIKQLQEQIANDVKKKIDSLNMMGMDSAQKWNYLMTEGSQAYTNFMNEVNSASPDPSKLAGYYNTLSQIFDALVAGIQQLGQAQQSFQQTIDSIQTQYDTIGKTHQQKLDYYNRQIQEAYAAYQSATDATTKAYYLEQINKWAQAGWGEMTDAEKQKSGQTLLDWLKQVNEQAKTDFQSLLTTAETFWATVGNYVKDTLNTAVDAASTDLKTLADKLAAIDWTPLQNLTASADSAATGLNSVASAASAIATAYGSSTPSGHASGLDYVPYDNYPATLHKGEAVITAKGNSALARIAGMTSQPQPITVVINAQGGDMAGFINYTVSAAKGQTVKLLRRNPAVLR